MKAVPLNYILKCFRNHSWRNLTWALFRWSVIVAAVQRQCSIGFLVPTSVHPSIFQHIKVTVAAGKQVTQMLFSPAMSCSSSWYHDTQIWTKLLLPLHGIKCSIFNAPFALKRVEMNRSFAVNTCLVCSGTKKFHCKKGGGGWSLTALFPSESTRHGAGIRPGGFQEWPPISRYLLLGLSDFPVPKLLGLKSPSYADICL